MLARRNRLTVENVAAQAYEEHTHVLYVDLTPSGLILAKDQDSTRVKHVVDHGWQLCCVVSEFPATYSKMVGAVMV